jgi:hypothetical protein
LIEGKAERCANRARGALERLIMEANWQSAPSVRLKAESMQGQAFRGVMKIVFCRIRAVNRPTVNSQSRGALGRACHMSAPACVARVASLHRLHQRQYQ